MKRLSLCAAAAFLLSASQAVAAPQCTEMRFLDQKGVLLPVNPPLIGIFLGDRPLFEGLPPAHAKSEAGRMVPCPEALVASAQKVFNDSCLTESSRQLAATQNKVDVSLVNQRCGEMAKSLVK
ncbi:MAG: hypothetical protein LCH56_13135 [Proteobacteria bacterium]|nr:hypothetical protein [Pseudomonadota bacterium]